MSGEDPHVTKFGQFGVGLFIRFCLIPTSDAYSDMRRMLHGLEAVNVVIGQLHPDSALGGITSAALREELLVNLQQVGIQVSPQDERLTVADRPQLNLSVNITPIESFPVYSVFVTLQLRQTACLTRNLIICEPVTTWEEASAIRTMSVSQLTEMQQEVRILIAHFVDAYLEENPKR